MAVGYTLQQQNYVLTLLGKKIIIITAKATNNQTIERGITMASAKKTLNPLEDIPSSKTEVTKPFMLAYMKSSKAKPEDIKWFKEIVSNPENQKEYINKLNGQPYTDIDIPKVRKLFCQRFYPQLVGKKNKNKSFIDSILDL